MIILYKLKRICSKFYNYYTLKHNHVKIGKYSINGKIRIFRVFIDAHNNNDTSIFIGNGFICNSGIEYNPIGGDTCTILRTIDEGVIKIGTNVGISNSSLNARSCIEIEDDVLIGGGVKIYDNDFHSLNYDIRMSNPFDNIIAKPVRINKGAFIGAGTYVLKGVTIGEKSIVGAGSVVSKDIPPGEIWAGNPARFIRKI